MTFTDRRLRAKRSAAINRPIILYLAHHLTLAGSSGERRVYDTFRREFYWPKMSTDVYDTVLHCQKFPIMGTEIKHQR